MATKKPSDFLSAGFPSCSIFRDTWHEMTAVIIMNARVVLGDHWDAITINEIMRTVIKHPPKFKGEPGLSSILLNKERMERVNNALKSPEDAAKFSWVWNRVMEEE